MDKIRLSDECKTIFLQIINDDYGEKYKQEDNGILALLHEENLIIVKNVDGIVSEVYPTNKGYAYVQSNPNLDNPKIWDDKKYIITTFISILSLTIAIISLIRTL